jgi:dihydroorotase-like cyclic amidohydrolase
VALLLRNVGLGDEPGCPVGDLLVVGGAIAGRGEGIEAPAEAEEVDLAGLVALPGVIDMHAPLAALRSKAAPADDLGSGTIAAACGGVTTVVLPVDPLAGEPAAGAFNDVVTRSKGAVQVDWAATIAATVATTADSVAPLLGMPGFAGLLLDLDGAAPAFPQAALQAASRSGAPLVVRMAGSLGPEADAARVRAIAELSAVANLPVHLLPLASKAALDALEPWTTASPSLAALCLEALPDGCGVRPGLGGEEDRDALWAALVDGRLVGVASDHRPAPSAGAVWTGIGSLEVLLPALLTAAEGRCDLAALVEAVAERPARRLGLWPRKGSLRVGADADIAIVDPAARWTVDPDRHQSRGSLAAWGGRELAARVVHVLARGDRVVWDGEPQFRPGRGRPVRVGD